MPTSANELLVVLMTVHCHRVHRLSRLVDQYYRLIWTQRGFKIPEGALEKVVVVGGRYSQQTTSILPQIH